MEEKNRSEKTTEAMLAGEIVGDTVGSGLGTIYNSFDSYISNPILSIISKVVTMFCVISMGLFFRYMTTGQKIGIMVALFVARTPYLIHKFKLKKYKKILNLPIEYTKPSYNEMSKDFSALDCTLIKLNGKTLGAVDIMRCGPRVIYTYSNYENEKYIKSDIGGVGNFEDLNGDFEKFIVIVKEYLYKNKKNKIKGN